MESDHDLDEGVFFPYIVPRSRMILRLFEQARIVPDNPFAFPLSMEVRLQISGQTQEVLYMDVLILRSHGCEGAMESYYKREQ